MSTTVSGASTPSFIRSIRVVPPARKRTRAPCWAVPAPAPVAMAAAASAARWNAKVCMAPQLLRACWMAATMFA